ncbi:MAG TPA: S9 family peptidase [Candidatus Krumholzibacteria bacterium]|nr:S9 family peptidase [Candidatus Krumholzibacteria bacterium]
MSPRRTAATFLIWLAALPGTLDAIAAEPPVAARRPHFTVTHEDTLRDDFFWLREKTNPEVRGYLEAENAYAAEMMAPTAGLQEMLYAEMLARVQETDVDVPYRDGDFYYYKRTEAGKQYPIHCRKKGSLGAAEEVLLDLNAMAEGLEFLSVGDVAPSDDGTLLAYTTDTTGFRQYVLHVKDLRTGELISSVAERVTGLAWAADNATLFYGQEDPATKRWHKVYRYVAGSDRSDLVYEETDELFDLYVARSRSRKYLFLIAASSITSEVWYVSAARPGDAPVSIAGRRDGHEYYVDHSGERFYIRTNDQGPNFRLVTAPVASPGEASWSQIWGHRGDVMLEAVDCFDRYYVLTEREGGVPQIRVADNRNGRSHRVVFPEPVYSVELEDNHTFETAQLRIAYESFVTPASVFDYHMKNRERVLLKEKPVPGYDRSKYRSERIEAPAPDGTRVPVSIVYRSDRKPKNRPMLLLGYGSYGASMDIWFSQERLSLLDRGAIFGIAHVRGGGELGKRWHEEGRLMNKMNTFTDFIACADWVVKKGYTSRDRLAITGRSAGGLLIGAVVNLRPDLCKAVFTAVPFVDMMNTMLDPTLPLTIGEYLEWGDPNEKAAYEYMKRYSPYDNVARREYPVMLVRTSFNDSQVMYWEPAKWVAKLRAHKTGDNLLLFRTKLEPGGHSGASGRYDRLRDTAYEYAFVLTQLGIGTRGD